MEASSNCPICGFDRPHQHTGEQVARHRGAVDRGDPISFDSYGRAFRELVEGHLIPCPKPHDTISQICRRAAIIQSGVDAPVPTLSQPIEPQGAVVVWQYRERFWDGAPWGPWHTFADKHERDSRVSVMQCDNWLTESRDLIEAALPVAVGAGEWVAEITGIDEYGPMLAWNMHWVDVGIGTKLYAWGKS